MGLITTHYFGTDDQLSTYVEERDDDGNVVFTSGERPSGSARFATPEDIAAFFQRTVDAQRAAFAASVAQAEQDHAARVADATAHRAALAELGLDESLQDALFPLPGEFTAPTYAEPTDQLMDAMRSYRLTDDQASVVLHRREV